MRDGGQPGDIGVEQPCERRGFGVTQLGEFVGRGRDGAVVLADLEDRGRPFFHRGGVSIGSEQFGKPSRPLLRVVDAVQMWSVSFLELLGTALGELVQGGGLDLAHEAHRADREVVVGLFEAAAAGLGERVDPGWPAPPGPRHGPERWAVTGHNVPGFFESIEVFAHASGCDTESLGHLGGGAWPVHQETASHALASTLLDFHNSIVA